MAAIALGIPGCDPRIARAAQLAQSVRNRLIFCALGWFVGFMWITDPLAWYGANQLARDFLMLGIAPASDVTSLRLVGDIGTGVLVVDAITTAVFVGAFACGGISHF